MIELSLEALGSYRESPSRFSKLPSHINSLSEGKLKKNLKLLKKSWSFKLFMRVTGKNEGDRTPVTRYSLKI